MSDASLGSALRGAVDLSSLRNRPASPAPGPASGGAGAAGAPDVVMDVSDATFAQVMELSSRVPVVVDMWSSRSEASAQLSPVLEKVTREVAGRIVLARVEIDHNPQIQQAFQVQSVPSVVALVGGRPVPLFNQAVPEEQVRDLFGQLLDVAAQAGVTGSVDVAPDAGAPEQPVEPPLPPLHQEAFDAIGRGDYAAAIAAYERALKENPRDDEAAAGLGQVRLLDRTAGADLHEARRAAAEAPDDVSAQLAVADLDVAGGHVEDAFDRLLDLFARVAGEDRAAVKDRLVELFGVVGPSDPRVVRARTRLTSLLF
ncbi:tetratricopeptide repeat protein [Microbacterium sp. ZXX196]|uniref:tetratricopeptide repeat protein n=1 Tax=Microbacterium sp. ZXX196 TaxID=2609291 RepID=UPI0012B75A78|nr:tetratricopeptide repeat protein [Microbacterium sp. ZXX196]MTE23696.1 tetratricopeptide repeat protein [Microbacterium sp. ZXX196]